MKQVAIDFETYLICEDQGSAPAPICLSFYDGTNSGVLVGDDIPAYLLTLNEDEEIIAHNIQFEFSVILKHYPQLTEWAMDKLDRNLVWCTLISEQIKAIASEHSASAVKLGLADLVKEYFDEDISESKNDSASWRLRYEELVSVPLKLWPEAALNYSLLDSIYAYRLRQEQTLTHLDSIRAAVMLGLMADRGFYKRKDYTDQLYDSLVQKLAPLQEVLVAAGVAHFDKHGAFKRKTKAIREHINETVSRPLSTDSGNIATNKAALQSYQEDPLINKWLEYVHTEKLASTYVKTIKDAKSVVRTDYNVVVDSGRTSARSSKLYPALNVQNLPRDGGIRECFSARPGFKLVSIDYSGLELVCAAQQLLSLYGTSKMADALNLGDTPADLHSALGSKLMSFDLKRDVSYDEFMVNKKDPLYSKYRTLAKPLNLGYPGGIGPRKMAATAKAQYGINMTERQASVYRQLFYETYPELHAFLKRDADLLAIGEVYSYVYKGMKRGGCTYCSLCNGLLMQTPAAFGTKRMLWRLLQNVIRRNDIKPLAFIHDEVLFEMIDDTQLDNRVEEMAYLMIDAMKEIIPDVRVAVESDVAVVWSKEGSGNTKKFWR